MKSISHIFDLESREQLKELLNDVCSFAKSITMVIIPTIKIIDDKYTRYCITEEGKEYLRKMIADEQTIRVIIEVELKDEKLLQDVIDYFEPKDTDTEPELCSDEFFTINESKDTDDKRDITIEFH